MRVTANQTRVTETAVRWYLRTHYRTPDDPGTPAMFCDPDKVGAFAVDGSALCDGKDTALFKLLVATTMFQRRQDVQVLRILRGISPSDAAELTSSPRLLDLVDATNCAHAKTVAELVRSCDLAKDPIKRHGCCVANPHVACHLKRHTVLLKRYGHFGKVPTSAALMLREAGARGLSDLRTAVLKSEKDPRKRAIALETMLSRSWRISQKIASMFLSAVCNPDLATTGAPWSRGIDWTYFVVVDSNVDLYLASINYRGAKTYDARRDFIQALARKIDLRRLDRRIRHSYNPRLVQQAVYLFMSAANRRVLANDCMHNVGACAVCPRQIAQRCPVQNTTSTLPRRKSRSLLPS